MGPDLYRQQFTTHHKRQAFKQFNHKGYKVIRPVIHNDSRQLLSQTILTLFQLRNGAHAQDTPITVNHRETVYWRDTEAGI